MKLLLIALLSIISNHICTGYPVVEGELSEKLPHENGTPIQSWFYVSNDTASNDSSPLGILDLEQKLVNKIKAVLKLVRDKVKDGFGNVEDFLFENGTSADAFNGRSSNDSSSLDMYGIGKKIANKVKEGIKTVKDKVKDKYDKVKNKVNNFKDKIGSKGGGSGVGGGYYRDRYDRDNKYDRDRYNRDYYRRDDDYSGGSGVPDPNAKWVGLGVGVFLIIGILTVLIYYKVKGDI